MPLPSDTVAIPVVKGLDTTTDTRLVPAPSLLEARNTQFAGGGAKKRVGHTSLVVRTEADIQIEPDNDTWVYGQGHGGFRAAEDDTRFLVGRNPRVGSLRSVFTRDDETVVWDGFRLLSYLPSQLDSQAPISAEVDGSATIPTATATPIAKFNQPQSHPEVAQNTLTRLVVWTDNNQEAQYAIYDVTTSALITRGKLAVTIAGYARAFTLGDWMHVAVRDDDDGLVKLFSISSRAVNEITYRSYGPCTHFDIYKVSDSEAILARSKAPNLHVAWIGTTGTGSQHTGTPITFDPTSTAVVNPTLVSVAVAHDGFIGLAYYSPTSSKIGFALWDENGAFFSQTSLSVTGVTKLTIAPKWVGMSSVIAPSSPTHVPYDVYWEDALGVYHVLFSPITTEGNDTFLGETLVRYHLKLVSRAWGVGDRTFVWAGQDSNVQATWFMLDEGLLPVGKLNFGVANVDGIGGPGVLRGVNFSGSDYQTCHLALDYKLRVAPDDSAQALVAIYTEPSIQLVEMDFLSTLSAAQAGRTTYIAGAQLWAYDGAELVEAGFHLGPEPTFEQVNGGGLTNPGTYSYRIDLCHRNAQNEEVRSLSILSSSMELTGSNASFDITIPTVLTRREDSYFLIYRNAMSSGTPLVNWWLLNSRDPSSADFLPNDLTQQEVTFTDNGSVDDTTIQTRELHPASDTWVQPISAPSCTVLASGRDRLWVAGGELPPGVVAPSRLFEPGDTPSFNPYLSIQVDRRNEPVTALGFIGEVAVIFRRNAAHILDSDGPDNNAQGFWNPPRLALSDLGAVSQRGVARIANGLIFLSPSGFRMLGPGGALTTMPEIDNTARNFAPVGSLVTENSEVRFYGTDSTLVFNYLYNTWATWTCTGVGVARTPEGFALLAKEDGCLWIETPGLYKDGSSTYSQRIRTSWLHGGNIGDFQRVRWIYGAGRYHSPHNLRLELYYDERDFWEERIEWSMPDDDSNSSLWGDSSWGVGVWGDLNSTINTLEDLTWDWERRPARQKCTAISISLEDVNTDGPGFELSAFALDVARKEGFNRLVARSGTDSAR